MERVEENDMDEVVENLWLGRLTATIDKAAMGRYGITHILSLGVRPIHLPETGVTKKMIHMADSPNEDLGSKLSDAVDFIARAIASGGVILVHC